MKIIVVLFTSLLLASCVCDDERDHQKKDKETKRMEALNKPN